MQFKKRSVSQPRRGLVANPFGKTSQPPIWTCRNRLKFSHLGFARRFSFEAVTWATNDIPLHQLHTFQYLIAYLYFQNGKFDKAQYHLYELLQTSDKNLLEEILEFAAILNLLTHYELGHHEHVHSLIRSLKRLHQKNRPLYEVEKMLFAYLGKLINANTPKERQNLYSEMNNTFNHLKSLETEQRAFNYFDFSYWTASKKFQE